MILTVKEGSKQHQLEFEEGKTILEVLVDNNIKSVHAPCGGKGICKKCEVILKGETEDKTLIACTTKAEDGMLIEVPLTKRVSFANTAYTGSYMPSPKGTGYAAAADIGTSSVILHLISLETGLSVASASQINVQRNWGTNVIARFETAASGYAQNLSLIIQKQLAQMLSLLCIGQKISPADVKYIAVCGNTMMEYFFAGLDPSKENPAHFEPIEFFGKEIDAAGLPGFEKSEFRGKIFIAPAVSSFIGGDSVSAIVSSGMCRSEEPVLLMDLGANGEIILGSDSRYVACAADASSAIKTSLMAHGMQAVEGAISAVRYEDGELKLEVLGNARPIGVCGSGFIDALAIMIKYGVIDGRGHIVKAEKLPDEMKKFIGQDERGKPVFCLTEDKKVFIAGSDISEFSLGKAAIYAGIKICAKEYGISLDKISRCCLSGGFGTFINPKSAAIAGLIPAELASETELLGNASMGGIISAAVSDKARDDMQKAASCVQYISLSSHPDFNDYYIEGMMFD